MSICVGSNISGEETEEYQTPLRGGCGHLNCGHGKDSEFIPVSVAGFMGVRARRLTQCSDW